MGWFEENDVFDDSRAAEELLDDDEISVGEAGFVRGYAET
jgi:hypothetical protein